MSGASLPPPEGPESWPSVASYFTRRRLRILYLTAVGALVFYLGYRLSAVLNPFLLALLVAYILDPAVRWMERKGVPRTAAIGGIYVVVLLAVGGIVWYSVAKTTSGIDKLRIKSLGGWYRDVNANGRLDPNEAYFSEDHIAREPGRAESSFLDLTDNGRLDAHEPRLIRADDGRLAIAPDAPDARLWTRKPGYLDQIRDYLSDKYKQLDKTQIDKATEAVKSNTSALASGAASVWNWVTGQLLGSIFTALSYLILVPVYTFFLLKGFDDILDKIEAHLPGRRRERIVAIARKIDRACSAFFRGRFLLCLGKALLTWIGLAIVGVDFAPFIGIANGSLAVIPVVGPLLSVVLAVTFSYGPEGWAGRIVGALVVIVIVEIAEAILNPILLGREVGLHPVTYLIALFVGGELLGFFGVLLAIPLAAVVKILFEEFVMPEVRHLAEERAEDERPPGPLELRIEPSAPLEGSALGEPPPAPTSAKAATGAARVPT